MSRSTTPPPADAPLAVRLRYLGLPASTRVTLTRNRSTLVSWTRRGGLRLHAGYSAAPDEILMAIVEYLAPFVSHRVRLAARRRFMTFPVWHHAESRPARRVTRRVPPEDAALVARLAEQHAVLNARHFAGKLSTIPISISPRMRRTLGVLRADRDGKPEEIAMSARHIRRDGWSAVTDTLLHEMVHQWQGEHRLPIDHRRTFRDKAREVGLNYVPGQSSRGAQSGRFSRVYRRRFL